MTEKAQENAPELEESGAPAPAISQVLEVSPLPVQVGLTEAALQELLNARFAALQESLLEQVERTAQSVKDRRIGKLEKTVEEITALRSQLEAAGGDWSALEKAARDGDLSKRLEALEARTSVTPAPSGDEAWKQEWQAESAKVLGAAAKLGVTLSDEEYSAALFGKKFASKGEAYAALQGAIFSKMKGESVAGLAAVASEGGEDIRPAPGAKNLRQKVADAKAKGAKPAELQALVDAQWDIVDKESKKDEARRLLAQAGLTAKEL